MGKYGCGFKIVSGRREPSRRDAFLIRKGILQEEEFAAVNRK
jgi:hypothetical protein